MFLKDVNQASSEYILQKRFPLVLEAKVTSQLLNRDLYRLSLENLTAREVAAIAETLKKL